MPIYVKRDQNNVVIAIITNFVAGGDTAGLLDITGTPVNIGDTVDDAKNVKPAPVNNGVPNPPPGG